MSRTVRDRCVPRMVGITQNEHVRLQPSAIFTYALPPGVARIEIEETSDGIAARMRDALAHRRCKAIAYPARRHGYLRVR